MIESTRKVFKGKDFKLTFLFFIASFILILGAVTPINVSAKQSEDVLTKILVKNNGVPVINTSYNALNVEMALKEIESGEFTAIS